MDSARLQFLADSFTSKDAIFNCSMCRKATFYLPLRLLTATLLLHGILALSTIAYMAQRFTDMSTSKFLSTWKSASWNRVKAAFTISGSKGTQRKLVFARTGLQFVRSVWTDLARAIMAYFSAFMISAIERLSAGLFTRKELNSALLSCFFLATKASFNLGFCAWRARTLVTL
jgi:hypothetical protein